MHGIQDALIILVEHRSGGQDPTPDQGLALGQPQRRGHDVPGVVEKDFGGIETIAHRAPRRRGARIRDRQGPGCRE